MEYDHTFEEDINLFLDKFIDEKKKVIKANCEGKETICTGCEYLKEGWWDEKKMIRSLNILLTIPAILGVFIVTKFVMVYL